MKDRLRFQLRTFVENVLFVDEQLSSHPVVSALVHPEDKRSLAISGIDPIIEDFDEMMRTKVKPNDPAK